VGVATRQTNDLGRYRIFGLPPGRYLIGAVVGQSVAGVVTADWPGYARTYFPGTPVPDDAQAVELGAVDALNVDFALARERLSRVAGTAYAAAGAPLQGYVSLTQSFRSGALASPPASMHTGDDGSFEFLHLAPGEYILHAATSPPDMSTEGELAAQFVTVNGVDATDLTVRLSPGSTIAGRVTFEGANPPEEIDVRLSAVPADPDFASFIGDPPARADVRDDGTFVMGGINGPRRLQLAQTPPGWRLKAVRVNGADATDGTLVFGTAEQSLRDVEVVLTNRVTELTAVSRSGNGSGVPPDFNVVVFPTDRARWYAGSRFLAYGVANRDGAVSVRGLPPGEYYLAAIDGRAGVGEAEALEDGGVLESLVAGRVTLTEGERRSVSVKVIDR
jgi:hypothetical protein